MVLLRFMVAMILIMGQMSGNGVGNPVIYVIITVRTMISLRLLCNFNYRFNLNTYLFCCFIHINFFVDLPPTTTPDYISTTVATTTPEYMSTTEHDYPINS